MTSARHEDVWIAHPQGRLFARIWNGPGPGKAPIVLFHDSLGCVDLWRDFPASLSAATGRTVIAYDRLGFGRSDPRQGRLPPAFVAEEAAAFFPLLRERLGLGSFIAFGHSVGGGMAVHCAVLYGAHCAALVTESAQAFVGDETRQGILAAKEGFRHADQFARLVKYHGEKARWVLDAWTETWLDPAFAGWSLAGVLPMVACPLLAIHGARDEYGSARHPAMIGELCAGPARIAMLPDTGHVPHRERPEEVVALLAAFTAQAA
ncbi:alpha/beta fold hydrolase [Massilia sp. LXY-6]|uniref:alpha/beta fold hydrolase n=1 Tax=Massilia sp. LXY-6 TaxID=3379823 RepID=UPI003EDFD36F